MGTGGILDTKTWGRLAVTPLDLACWFFTYIYEHIIYACRYTLTSYNTVNTHTYTHMYENSCNLIMLHSHKPHAKKTTNSQGDAQTQTHSVFRDAGMWTHNNTHTKDKHKHSFIPAPHWQHVGLLSVLSGLGLSSSCLFPAASLRQIWSMWTCTLSRSSVRWDERKWEVLFFLWR